MIKRPYINKRGRLVLGEEQKKHKETKRQMFRCTSYSINKSSREKKKTWQEETE